MSCRSIRAEENVCPVGSRHHELATCLYPQQIGLTPEQINTYYDRMSFYTPFTQQTPKKKLAPDFTIEEGMQENFIHCILHIRRITTLHEGMRWPDIKRYGILIYRRDMANQRVTDEMPPNDLRYAIQIPRSVIVAGIQPNPRRN